MKNITINLLINDEVAYEKDVLTLKKLNLL